MIISPTHGFVFLCMPKCASTSTEDVLRPYGDIVTGYAPEYKHMTFRRYQRFFEPLVREISKGKEEPPEVLCLIREPADWLYSWYRYRQRSELQRQGDAKLKSTIGMSYVEFARLYVSSDARSPAGIGRQIRMLKDKDGKFGKISIYRYEDYEAFMNYMSSKVGVRLQARWMNESPPSISDLPRLVPDSLKQYYRAAREYMFLKSRKIVRKYRIAEPAPAAGPPDLPFLREFLRDEYNVYDSIPKGQSLDLSRWSLSQ